MEQEFVLNCERIVDVRINVSGRGLFLYQDDDFILIPWVKVLEFISLVNKAKEIHDVNNPK